MMATTERHQKTSGRRPDVSAGFDKLTLNPAPRLRRVRHQVSRPSQARVEEAWRSVGKALADAVISVRQTFKTNR